MKQKTRWQRNPHGREQGVKLNKKESQALEMLQPIQEAILDR